MKENNIQPNDISHETIELLFQQQIMMITQRSVFDVNGFVKNTSF